MKLAMGSDHAGFSYKEMIKAHLQKQGIEVIDFGTFSAARCDYPDFVRPAAEAVAAHEADAGIVLGGSGNGEAIVANKVRGIRCAVCWNIETAAWAKSHNNANMIAIGERTVSSETALAVVDTWMTTRFDGGRHARRIKKIEMG